MYFFRKCSKEILKSCLEDAFEKIFNGNESEVEDLSSDKDGDDIDYFILAGHCFRNF